MRLLVDSGATYSLLRRRSGRTLGWSRCGNDDCFTTGGHDGGAAAHWRVQAVAAAWRAFHTPVILGEAGDEALLGAVTLEIFGLILHPFSRTLEPMRAMLARFDAESAQT